MPRKRRESEEDTIAPASPAKSPESDSEPPAKSTPASKKRAGAPLQNHSRGSVNHADEAVVTNLKLMEAHQSLTREVHQFIKDVNKKLDFLCAAEEARQQPEWSGHMTTLLNHYVLARPLTRLSKEKTSVFLALYKELKFSVCESAASVQVEFVKKHRDHTTSSMRKFCARMRKELVGTLIPEWVKLTPERVASGDLEEHAAKRLFGNDRTAEPALKNLAERLRGQVGLPNARTTEETLWFILGELVPLVNRAFRERNGRTKLAAARYLRAKAVVDPTLHYTALSPARLVQILRELDFEVVIEAEGAEDDEE